MLHSTYCTCTIYHAIFSIIHACHVHVSIQYHVLYMYMSHILSMAYTRLIVFDCTYTLMLLVTMQSHTIIHMVRISHVIFQIRLAARVH